MDLMIQHLGKGIGLILLLSMPAVLMAAGIGLIVGILQAVTQVQEQTISAAPKIVFVFLLIIFAGPMMLDVMKEYLNESIVLGTEVIPKDEDMLLPPKPRLAYGEENSRFDFFKEKRHYPSGGKIKAMMKGPSPAQEMVQKQKSGALVKTQKITPKPGVGEQIYIKRRDRNELPKPPDRR